MTVKKRKFFFRKIAGYNDPIALPPNIFQLVADFLIARCNSAAKNKVEVRNIPFLKDLKKCSDYLNKIFMFFKTAEAEDKTGIDRNVIFFFQMPDFSGSPCRMENRSIHSMRNNHDLVFFRAFGKF